jgi:hypothetical protein
MGTSKNGPAPSGLMTTVRIGIHLPPVGDSELVDGAKYQAFRTLARAHRSFGGRGATAVRSYQ